MSSIPNSESLQPLNAKSIASQFPSLFKEFSSEINSFTEPIEPFTDSTWLGHLELLFSLRICYLDAFRSLRRVIFTGPSTNDYSASAAGREEYLDSVRNLMDAVEANESKRLNTVKEELHPRIVRLVNRYELNKEESKLFYLLFMRSATKSNLVRASVGVHKNVKEFFIEICEMNYLELDQFLDEKRPHIAEGIIIHSEEDPDGNLISMSNYAVSILLGLPIKREQRIQLARTELLSIIEPTSNQEESKRFKHNEVNEDIKSNSMENISHLINGEVSPFQIKQSKLNDEKFPFLDKDATVNESKQQNDVETMPIIENKLQSKTKSQKDDEEEEGGGEKERKESMDVFTFKELSSLSKPLYDDENNGGKDVEKKKYDENNMDVDNTELKEDIIPYASSLEYLDDAFNSLNLMFRICNARHKANMKDVMNEKSYFSDYYAHSKAPNLRELKAKLRFLKNEMEERLRVTEISTQKGNAKLPRLEVLARKLNLSEFEKNVVIMLAGIMISPIVSKTYHVEIENSVKTSYESTIQVKDILNIFFDSFREQVLARPFFYKSSKLSSRGIISLHSSRFSSISSDLMDQKVDLDRRILDWIVGLDTDMNELVEGSHLYKPKVTMDQVILPEEQKSMLLKTVENFDKFKAYRHTSGLDEVITYGSGLVILFCGGSGTGKTMTANAIANHLGKKVLLVDFNLLSSSMPSYGEDSSKDLRGLFRDSEMNDAIMFFDECESIFAQRNSGGDRLLNTLLTDIERHDGIIILATNRPLDLDEAMHRRITCVSEFKSPDHFQRELIWKVSTQRLPVDKNIDWKNIALKYELTGGFIKNAIVSALLVAISRDSSNPIINEEDIATGCKLQMRGSLQMKTFQHRVVPTSGLDGLILSPNLQDRLGDILQFERARAVLVGQWAFDPQRLGCVCFFWGPHGSGKLSAAKALGFELGRPLKVVSCAQLMSHDDKSKSTSAISTLFKDARLMDAILVLENFQILDEEIGSGRLVAGSVNAYSNYTLGLLLHEVEKFPGLCIIIATSQLGKTFHYLDPEILRRLKFVVEFSFPDSKLRARLWQCMLPKKVPLSNDVNFSELGKKFELGTGAINSAIVRAASFAALRSIDLEKENIQVHQKDFLRAAEMEVKHGHDELHEIVMRAFI